MEIIHPLCCGLDVHAKAVVACLITHGKQAIRTFSTMTDDLLKLVDWLVGAGCTHVAIESTGVYWRPVFNLLEGVLEVVLVNARYVQGRPGRKTGAKDCEWRADLRCHGLVKASFIPPLPIRELRERTRYRQSLLRDRTALANRIQKLVESGNIKLGQVASDALGVSGRLMLRRLAAGETAAEQRSNLARRPLKRQKAELRRALDGRLTAAQRWVLGELLDQYEQIEARVAKVDVQIRAAGEASPDPFVRAAVELLDTMPGVGEQVAHTIIAEIGVEMSRFPSDRHLASWAGRCPGNHESAGKRKSGTTTKGSTDLRAALVQAARVARHSKGTDLSAHYHRLVRRLGKKKACVAVGHSILVWV
jgi:transposase